MSVLASDRDSLETSLEPGNQPGAWKTSEAPGAAAKFRRVPEDRSRMDEDEDASEPLRRTGGRPRVTLTVLTRKDRGGSSMGRSGGGRLTAC